MEKSVANIPMTEQEREAKMGRARRFIIKALQHARNKLQLSPVAELFRESPTLIPSDADEALYALDRVHNVQRNF